MSLSRGERLGPYEIVARIGEGGMGEVWTARDTRLNRTVAIKRGAGQFSERFEREAHAIAALNHPHLCSLYDVGPDYLVMEHVDGKPLAGPLPLAEALEYARQILDALDAAHRRGIVHRDLKPANILVTRSGVKLLDFGLAKTAAAAIGGDQVTAPGVAPLTGVGTILGTLQYMAPEQIEGKDTDARSDIFAFGLVLYEMITGKRPFEGEPGEPDRLDPERSAAADQRSAADHAEGARPRRADVPGERSGQALAIGPRGEARAGVAGARRAVAGSRDGGLDATRPRAPRLAGRRRGARAGCGRQHRVDVQTGTSAGGRGDAVPDSAARELDLRAVHVESHRMAESSP